MPAVQPLVTGHRICMPKSGFVGFLKTGAVLSQSGNELISQEIDALHDIYDSPVFLFEDVAPTGVKKSEFSTTERYINLLPIESDFYGAYRFMLDKWQSYESLSACRHAYQKQFRLKRELWTKKRALNLDDPYNKAIQANDLGYQLIGTFSKVKGHQLAMRPMAYPSSNHFLRKMIETFSNQKLFLRRSKSKQMSFN